ncbi:LCP family protein [Agreia sp.]|uniref:LCP family protein n=1 Tax=Agreia sp. TaxID=1872416 RepID=UPI0035BBEECE
MSKNTATTRVRRHPWRTAAVIVGVLALVGGGSATAYAMQLGHTWDEKTVKLADAFPADEVRPEPLAPSETHVAQNILVLGSDTRGDSNTTIDALEGQRSDAIMVVHIPADRQRITVMSIMRDSWVDIPGHGQAKINAALSFGGVPLAVQTIEGMIGTRIDHVAVVDFTGFRGVADALGGVDVYNSVAFESSKMPGHYFERGMQVMNGDEALAFVRERYAFDDGDFQRARNQQEFAKGVMSEFMNAAVLANPARIGGLVSAIAPYLVVDSGFDAAYVGQLALELRDVTPSDVSFFTAPTSGTGTSSDGQSIVNVDWDAFAAVRSAFETDSADGFSALTAAN